MGGRVAPESVHAAGKADSRRSRHSIEYIVRSCRSIKHYAESSKYPGKPWEGLGEGMTGSDLSIKKTALAALLRMKGRNQSGRREMIRS